MRRRSAGFTLLELLIVLVIIGLTLGMVSFASTKTDAKVVKTEAQRIALLLQVARDEAIVRNRPIAFDADSEGYHFLIREDNGWNPLAQDDLLRPRQFDRSPMQVILKPAPTGVGPLLTFGREPVQDPFVLTLALGDAHVAIQADGIGHYTVAE